MKRQRKTPLGSGATHAVLGELLPSYERSRPSVRAIISDRWQWAHKHAKATVSVDICMGGCRIFFFGGGGGM